MSPVGFTPNPARSDGGSVEGTGGTAFESGIQRPGPLGHLTEMLKRHDNFYSLDGLMLINGYDFGFYKAALFSVTCFLFRWKRSNTFIIVPLVLIRCVPELPMTHWFWSSTNQICTNYISKSKQNSIEIYYLNIHYCNQMRNISEIDFLLREKGKEFSQSYESYYKGLKNT